MGKIPTPCNAATYRAAALALAQAEKPKVLVEVGVYAGALSKLLATIPSLVRQYVIDSWEEGYSKFSQTHMDGIADGVLTWARSEPRVICIRSRSVAAAQLFEDESVDFFHTDGDHSLAGVRADIATWLPKVKKGCVISGDNYEAPTVAQAVREAFPKHQLLASGRLWWVRK